ncbi:kinesin light chain protein 2, isoform a, putative [Brugia malayi]|uniref:Kinesin light chain protein 2, isoform a, putative n=1 Tax=Brugia malayi TaxID=6279 RepID=A0A4E9FM85_BRUMA|nr:kinesin light chain protein 2, isoform a, putative [Brugia malayi]VIO97542.1 kinesin light chain protein 2, isoform a, putative [Brugia malayi]
MEVELMLHKTVIYLTFGIIITRVEVHLCCTKMDSEFFPTLKSSRIIILSSRNRIRWRKLV